MKLDMDLKTLAMIITTACALAGFYYSTQARLDVVEVKIEKVNTILYIIYIPILYIEIPFSDATKILSPKTLRS